MSTIAHRCGKMESALRLTRGRWGGPGGRLKGGRMKSKLLAGTATAALSLTLFSHSTSAATLDGGVGRLDKLERENAELRKQVRTLSSERGTRPAPAPYAAAAPVA